MLIKQNIAKFKPLLTDVAQTSHYQVKFGGLRSALMGFLRRKGVDSRFIADSAGLLCSSASLPGSSLATADISGNFMGVMEKMAHTRIYSEIQLEFYVDSDYRMLKFLEHWMEFIGGASDEVESNNGYFYRMEYPIEYKCQQTKIIKFDRDYNTELEYTFWNMFPINLSSTPVTYQSSDLLKVSIAFNFERYIAGKSGSKNQHVGNHSNFSLSS